MRADGGGALGIVVREVFQRLVGEDHAPAEGVVRPVALDHDDLVVGILSFIVIAK